MSCGLDPALLWLWRRPATVAPDLTPSLGISMCQGWALKSKKKKWEGAK